MKIQTKSYKTTSYMIEDKKKIVARIEYYEDIALDSLIEKLKEMLNNEKISE